MSINKENIQKWFPHIAVWLLFTILTIFVLKESNAQEEFWKNRYFFQLIIAILAFYGNYLFLVPRYFLRGQRVRFFIMLLVFAMCLFFLFAAITHQFEVKQHPHEPPPFGERHLAEPPPKHLQLNRRTVLHPRVFDDMLFIILVLGFSTGMRIVQNSRQEEEQQKEMEKAHVETELAFLKNQINPHFFFNSLNNIYALIAIDSEAAQKAVEKLSGLMRYLIYESNVKTVKLEKEFEFTHNYIDLMKQRLSSKVKLIIDIQYDIPDIEVPPLIFIPFVENAFKHGVSYRDESFISIMLRVSGGKIHFSCKNSIPQTENKGTIEKGGMGIVNIKKRLELLYGKSAQFVQRTQDNSFTVELTLPVNYTL